MEDTIDNQRKRQDVLRMAIPVLIEILMGALFGMVDMIMLGNYGSSSTSIPGIGAVGITNQFTFIGLSLVQALNVGGTAMVARYIGAKREDRIEGVIRHVVILTQIVIVLPLLLIGYFNTVGVMKFIGAQPDMITVGLGYFRAILFGFIFQAFNFSIFAALRGAGETKIPMKINLFVNFLNVIGNAGLIYGLFGLPELGVLGAGISTSISHVVATIILLVLFAKDRLIIKIDLKNRFKFQKDIIYNLVRIGMPAMLEQIALRLGLLLFTRVVTGLGTNSYAAHQIVLNLLSISLAPGQSFGIAASALVGKSLGEHNLELAESYIETCLRMAGIISFILAIVFFFFGGPLASLFNKSPEVIEESRRALRLISFIQPFQSSQLTMAGGLRGAGDTVWTLITTTVCILGVRNIMARIFIKVFALGLMGAWAGVAVDQGLRWLLVYIRYRKGKWKYVEIR